MLVLGIDPGLRTTGYGLVEGSKRGVSLQHSGLIQTPEGVGLPARLHAIHQHLHRLVARTCPSLIAIEDVFAASRHPRTAIMMGHVRGVICLVAAEARIDLLALPPASVKHAIAGFGAASKGQVQHAVGRFLGLARPLDRHVADATAIALIALSRGGYRFWQSEAPPVESATPGAPARASSAARRFGEVGR